MLLVSLRATKLGTVENCGADQVLVRAFRNRRSRLVLIVAVALVVIIALVAAAVVTQRGDRASANEPQAKGSPASLGIDPMKGTCPKAEPGKLPPNALAGATNASLAYFEGVEEAEGQYAVFANRGLDEDFFRHHCPELSPQRAKLLQKRTVVVSLVWPKMVPSASMSQYTVFVAKQSLRASTRCGGCGTEGGAPARLLRTSLEKV